MLRSKQRLALLLVSLPIVIVAVALVYMLGMGVLENEPRGFWESLEWAAESLATTGYGSDAHWDHPLMVVFVVLVQFGGVFLVFLIFPIYLIPFLEERFESRLPKSVPGMSDHVVVYRYGAAVATLLDEMKRAEVATVVIEEDAAQVRRLMERGHLVVQGSLDDSSLERSSLLAARALVANGKDDENAAVILAARQAGFQGDVLAIVEEPYHRKPMMLAGATAVFTPRHILGAALAARASERISPRVEGAQVLGKLVVSEIKIGAQSALVGKTLAESNLGHRTGISVIGQWVEGRLMAPPKADMKLERAGILIVAGSEEAIQRLGEVCAGTTRLRRTGPFVLAGYGEVGRKVAELLRDVGERVEVIDREEGEGVDRVGNILDHRVLEMAGLREAQAVILAVDSDAATLFATVILKDFAPEVPVIARVNQAQNVQRIHQAGADFALSISQVSGQILAGRLLGRESISLDPKVTVLKVSSSGLEGNHPAQLGIRERTGASVVAVERSGNLVLEFGPDFRFLEGNEVYICGSVEAMQSFVETFPQPAPRRPAVTG
ncbi:MAG: TrkA family potassium uptake protein [Acidobacteria bacterium]|nr:TrkA family potassium uptake protein [Acidobacteriota bacterium]